MNDQSHITQAKEIPTMNHNGNGNHTLSSLLDIQLIPVRFEFSHPTATTVCVAGTFNNWHPAECFMESRGNGQWLIDTPIAPGRYEYRLVVDGQWMADPLATKDIANAFGGRNSILVVASIPDHVPTVAVTTSTPPVAVPAGKLKRKSVVAEEPVKTTAGIWIDHRKAVLAIESSEGEKIIEIQSKTEKQPRRNDGADAAGRYRDGVPTARHGDNEFMAHLNVFYDEVIAAVQRAAFILLFGPGEAKGELKKRLDAVNLGARIVAMETVDKMTHRQIAAKVRYYVKR